MTDTVDTTSPPTTDAPAHAPVAPADNVVAFPGVYRAPFLTREERAEIQSQAQPDSQPEAQPEARSTPDQSPVRQIGVAEDTRLGNIAEVIRARVGTLTKVPEADLCTLPLNTRDFLYGLQEAKRVPVTAVASAFARVANRTDDGVGVLADHMLPLDVTSVADFLALPKKRRLAKKVKHYVTIAEIVAELAEMDVRHALARIFEGTSYAPRENELESDERRALRSLATSLQRIPTYLDTVQPLRTYFDRQERHEVLPFATGDDVSIDTVDAFWWWHHYGFPQIRLARRWTEQRRVNVVVSAIPPSERYSGTYGSINWDDAWHYEAGPVMARMQADANNSDVLSIGVANTRRTVAIIQPEILLSLEDRDYSDLHINPEDAFTAGWHSFQVSTPHGPRLAAWCDPNLEEDAGDEFDDSEDRPPIVTVHALDMDFLETHWEGMWSIIPLKLPLIAPTAPPGVSTKEPRRPLFQHLARFRWEAGESRFGNNATLPAIIERALRNDVSHLNRLATYKRPNSKLAVRKTDQKEGYGLISELLRDYRRRVTVLNAWLQKLTQKVEADMDTIDALFSRRMPLTTPNALYDDDQSDGDQADGIDEDGHDSPDEKEQEDTSGETGGNKVDEAPAAPA